MRMVKYALIGAFFGIVLVKGEVISWFRIQEMFRFESFHMFGIIGSAIAVAFITTQLLIRKGGKSKDGEAFKLEGNEFKWKAHLIGGSLFGLGWALTGACPGPLYALVGSGQSVVLVALGSAIAGTFLYGFLKDKLPH
jgi:uncharacterized membrane protein YedE/YeeE